MNLINKEIQVYIVGFDIEKMMPFAKKENIPSAAGLAQREIISTLLECEDIEIIDYTDDIAIIVSDRGMFTEGVPIFEVITPDNTILHLAGTILFAKNIYTSDSVEIGGLNLMEIHYLVQNLEIKVKGTIIT